ncbi:MAG: bifunctional (p)ppGpp synthetase/guanosine-3',5'-bis(diphosphate) 3'-pyrophosphohydrolase [Calditrichales bacterium]|nr:MAG: bifunctional (p)ppGpp synthetase/guanosine-3',5'-bis(diphosphate) 3'-pyrophosphohydrolase [Calditrichales bacterium]
MSTDKILNKLHEKYDTRFEQMLKTVSEYTIPEELPVLKKAYEYSLSAHKNQQRYSGEPYFDHLYEVANILSGLKMDSTTIAAGFLHDSVEDTGIDLPEIEELFGKEIAALVDGVTKIGELKFESREKRQAETFRKMLLSMARDARVIIIKFADRLHNMRTLEHLPEKKRNRIAIETKDVYIPLAHRFGIATIKWELEDLVLKQVDQEAYEDINRKVNQRREEREKYIGEITDPILKDLKKARIKSSVSGRAKHFYSIYDKMKRRSKPFEEIYDLLAIRIIVDKIEECYYALGIVHNLYMPVYDRFKDYIAMPKLNGYQSLHTTVVGKMGRMIEIQIRTWDMHWTAEIGIAAHWRYKEGDSGDDEFERHMGWIRNLVDSQMQEEDPKDFMDNLKIDLFQDEVFVFTPKGDLFKLPRQSTPIDFAFAVHTWVGMHCIGAKVNGRIVPLKSELKSGDQVEIITSANQEPHQDWLAFVKTGKAIQRIKKYLREVQQNQTLKFGEEILSKYLKKYNLSADSDDFQKVIPKLGFQNLESLLLELGRGELTTEGISNTLFPPEAPKEKKESFFSKYIRRARSATGINVQGMDNMLINFGKCCQPVPGDKITGFITMGKGIMVHRIDCKNMMNLAENHEKRIDVSWDIDKDSFYQVHLTILSEDRRNLLRDISEAISRNNTNIIMVEFKLEDVLVKGNLIIEVSNLHHLTKIIHTIQKLKGIISVDRVDKDIEQVS